MRLDKMTPPTLFAVLMVATAVQALAGPAEDREVLAAAQRFVSKPFFAAGTAVEALDPPTAAVPYWRARLAPTGFLVLSASEGRASVWAFSATGALESEGMPSGPLSQWLRESRPPTATIAATDPAPAAGASRLDLGPPSRVLMEPLLSTHWSQWAPYNQQAPTVTNGLAGYAGHAPVGCVPVAVGQLLRYYGWPAQGSGSDSYRDDEGNSQGDYAVSWTNTIPWESYKDSLAFGCAESPDVVDPLAAFLFQLGVTARMNYEAEGSSSDVLLLANTLSQRLAYAWGTFVKSNETRFPELLEQEILARRPVLVNLNTQNGHTVVADGLAEDEGVRYVHLNFGWGGQDDGWYTGYAVGTNAPTLFSSLVAGVHPPLEEMGVLCAPNFVDWVATNGLVPAQELRVFAATTNRLNYTLTASPAWLSVTPASGSAGNEPAIHQVAFDSAQIPPGVQDGYVRIEGDGPNLPRTVRYRIYKPELPSVTQQPKDMKTPHPTNQVMSVTAAPGATHTPCAIDDVLRYQWYFNGTALPNTPYNWCYTVGYGDYQCEVSGLGGATRSLVAVVQPEDRGSRLQVLQRTSTELLLQVSNVQNGQATLESSTDLRNWTVVQSFALKPSQSVGIWLTISKKEKSRYYRVKE